MGNQTLFPMWEEQPSTSIRATQQSLPLRVGGAWGHGAAVVDHQAKEYQHPLLMFFKKSNRN